MPTKMSIHKDLIKGICPICNKKTGYTYEIMGYVTCWSCAEESPLKDWKPK